MAWDADLEALLRADLLDRPGVTEMRLFGGLAFLSGGHMICGLHPGGIFIRVGREAEVAALALPGVAPMRFGRSERPMTGVVALSPAAAREPAIRGALVAGAARHAAGLPPKPAAAPRRSGGKAPRTPL